MQVGSTQETTQVKGPEGAGKAGGEWCRTVNRSDG